MLIAAEALMAPILLNTILEFLPTILLPTLVSVQTVLDVEPRWLCWTSTKQSSSSWYCSTHGEM